MGKLFNAYFKRVRSEFNIKIPCKHFEYKLFKLENF